MNALVDLLNYPVPALRSLSEAGVQRLGWTLVHFLWQGALAAGGLWLALRLLGRRRPQVRYLVACLALPAGPRPRRTAAVAGGVVLTAMVAAVILHVSAQPGALADETAATVSSAPAAADNATRPATQPGGIKGSPRVRRIANIITLRQNATDADLAALKDARGIVELRMGGLDSGGAGPFITDAGLANIRGWRDLRIIQLPGLSIHKDGLQRTPQHITDEGLKHLAGLKKLEKLVLYEQEITDAGLAHLSGLLGLRELWLDFIPLSDAGLKHLRGLRKLRVLRFYNARITDAGLVHLKGMADMEDLQLGRARVTDKGLTTIIGRMHKLRTLDLQGNPISDEGLSALANLPDMQWLCLADTLISDKGLAQVAMLHKLQYLFLQGTGITDTGLARLAGLKRLKRLNVKKTAVTRGGIQRLKLALPKLEIVSSPPPAARSRPGRHSPPATQPADAAAAKEFERLWAELVSNDRGRGDKAVAVMAAMGDKAVGFLRSRLLPDAKTAERIKVLIADMDNDRFAVRAKAHKAVEDIGKPALPVLTGALNDKGLSAETRWRLTQLVAKLTALQVDKAEIRRLGRAVWILGRIKTEPAREVLTRLARGPAGDAVAASARQVMAPWAWQEFVAASAFLCEKAGSRELAAKRFAAMADRNPGQRNTAVARELAGLLRQMAKEDAKFQEPKDPRALSAKRRIDYLVYKLRDVHERAFDVPSKVRVLGFYGGMPGGVLSGMSGDNAATALRRLGKPAMPVLLGLLTDHRPTRSRDEGMNGDHILRYCDVAIEIIEAISARKFDKPRGRGVYLANVEEATREDVVARVKQWWKRNQHRTEAEWIRDSFPETGIPTTAHLGSAERLVELEGAKSVEFFRQRLKAEPTNAHIIRLLWKAGGEAVLEDIRAKTSSKSPATRASAYRVLVRAGVDGTVEAVLKEIEAEIEGMEGPSASRQRDYVSSFVYSLAHSGRSEAVLAAARLIEHDDPKVGYQAFRQVMYAHRAKQGLAPATVKMLMPYVASALQNEKFSTYARYWAASWMVKAAKLSIPLPEAPTPATRKAAVAAVSGWWAKHKDEYPKAAKVEARLGEKYLPKTETKPSSQPTVGLLKDRVAKLSLAELAEKIVVRRGFSSREHLEVRPWFKSKIAHAKPAVRAKVIRLLADMVAKLQEGTRWETLGTLHDRRHLLWYLGDLGARKELLAILARHKSFDCCGSPALMESIGACGRREDAWLLVRRFADLSGDGSVECLHKALKKLTGLTIAEPSPQTKDAYAKLWTERLIRAGIQPGKPTSQPSEGAMAKSIR